MAIKIVVPELGESVVEATVAEWLVKEGDQVAAGQPVVRLETDKVDLDVSAERSGVLARVEKDAGADVQIGDVLGLIEEAGGAAAPPEGAPGEGASAEDTSSSGSPAGTAEAEKASRAFTPEPEERVAAAQAADGQAPEGDTKPGGGPPAREVTPVARRVAEEHGVDVARIEGSGPQGRVTKEDVQNYLQQAPPAPTRAPAPQPLPARPGAGPSKPAPAAPAAVESTAMGRPEERVRMSRRRQTIARRLVEAQQTAAMLTTFNEIDMSAVMEVRRRRKDSFRERHGINLGFMSFFVKASIGALKAFPHLNAEIQGDQILLKRYYDIGIAVGAAEGLVVPVLRDADRMSFAQVEQGIKELAGKAQDGSLSLEDLRGGTFTITNGGVFGSLLSTPILNPPQVGILGMHKIEERPIALDGQVVVRPMMYVALSYDHRIVDGREAVQFLVRIKELVEDPEALLLEG